MKHHHHSRRPSIGITPDLAEATAQDPAAYSLKLSYTEAVIRAGGLPFVLPHSTEWAVIEGLLDRVSGLVVSGGAFDIPPAFYGETPREGLGPVKVARTEFELALLRVALQKKTPVLGICGGMQLINVALGGTLHQDIKTELPSARVHQQTHDRSQPQHPVDVRDHTILADVVGRGQLMVNSTHHQSIHRVAEGLVVAAVAPDGVVEAIEREGEAFVMGVQWHPELMIDSVPPNLGIYKALVARARDRRR